VRAVSWKNAARRFVARLKARPALGFAAAGTVAASELIAASGLRGLWAGIASFSAFCAANAAFAEIWNSADGGFDADRCFETLILFLIPCPFFIAFAFLSTLVVSGPDNPSLTVLFAQAYGMKLLAFLMTILSAVSVQSLARENDGAFDALRDGARIFAANLPLVLAAVLVSFALDHLIGRLWVEWRAGAIDVGPRGLAVAYLVKAWLGSAATMLAIVGLPLQARASGLLEKN
jgi:hypothetical protein